MTMQDPIADMLTRIRNAQMAGHEVVSMPSSRLKHVIAGVLCEEGYIADATVEGEKVRQLKLQLKYYRGRPVIQELKRISRPGLRIYKGAGQLPRNRNGLGILIISTSSGVISDHEARTRGIGGEVLCSVF